MRMYGHNWTDTVKALGISVMANNRQHCTPRLCLSPSMCSQRDRRRAQRSTPRGGHGETDHLEGDLGFVYEQEINQCRGAASSASK